MENKIHVPNHQPARVISCYIYSRFWDCYLSRHLLKRLWGARTSQSAGSCFPISGVKVKPSGRPSGKHTKNGDLIIILTDELIFFRGVGQPPTRLMIGPWRGKWWQTVHGVEPLVFANPTILPLSTHLSSKSPEFPVGTLRYIYIHIFSYIGSRSRPLIGNLKRLAVFKQQTRGFGRFGHPRNYMEHCPHDISMRISYTN